MNFQESDQNMVNQHAVIYWQSNIGKTYMYGSTINYITKDHVIFQNDLFSVGSIVHSWQSLSQYQAQRSGKQLPLLLAGTKYRLTLNASIVPEKSIYLQLKFYDRYENIIDRITIKDKVEKFRYPENAYAYDVELINVGVKKIVFHNIEINDAKFDDQQISNDQGLHVSDVLNENVESRDLHVIFTEPVIGTIATVPADICDQIPDVIQITSSRLYGQFYLSNQIEKDIIFMLDRLQKLYDIETINFIGYGPISSAAALYYSNQIDSGFAYVSSDYGQLSAARNMIYTDGYEKFITAKKSFDETPKTIYHHVDPMSSSLQIVANLLDKSSRLKSYINTIN